MIKKKNKLATHRFLDEAGDTTVYGKGKTNIIGTNGVSNCFIIGMLKFKEPIETVREKIISLQKKIIDDPYFNVPSIQKKTQGAGYYLHATDDLPEVRKMFFDLIKTIDGDGSFLYCEDINTMHELEKYLIKDNITKV